MNESPPPSIVPSPPPVPSIHVASDALGGAKVSLAPGTVIAAAGPHPSPWLVVVGQLDALVAIAAFALWGGRHVVDPSVAGSLIVAVVLAKRGVSALPQLPSSSGLLVGILSAFRRDRDKPGGGGGAAP